MKQQGLTVIEVIVSLAILGVLTAVLTTSLVTSMRQNQVAGQRTQAAQVLNYLGRRVAGGDNAVLSPNVNNPLVWAYGELPAAFPDLSSEGSFVEPAAYRANVATIGNISLAGASAVQYQVQVCWQSSEGEQCVTADTIGPQPTPGGSPPPLPGIN